jgi:hypothetical protein
MLPSSSIYLEVSGMKIPANAEPSNFMGYVFGFKPPDLETLPIIEGSLDQTYLTGQYIKFQSLLQIAIYSTVSMIYKLFSL